MALSPTENRYLDTLTEREFPTFTPTEAEVASPEGGNDVLLAAGPSQTMTDGGPMITGEIKPTPRNPAMGGVADFVRGVRDLANQYEMKEWVPLLGKMGVGDLLLGKSPEELENWAYGNAPMAMPPSGTGGFVPVMKTGRKEGLADTLFLGLDASGVGKGVGMAGKAGAKALAPKAGEILSDYMSRSGLKMNLMAYHGTPHNFDKFDSKKIGTGEGAQAYGYGLYFAEDKKVADGYHASLSLKVAQVDGKIPDRNTLEWEAANSIASNGYEAALAQAQKSSEFKFVSPEGRAKYQELVKVIEGMKGRKVEDKASGGVFTVDIPDAMVSKMLDWDKPIREQAPEVRDAIIKSFPGTSVNGKYIDVLNSGKKGRALFDDLAVIADKRGAPGMRTAELAMRKAGIPGIRYLDEGSRDAGKGTRNIVVFPGGEDQIKIIKTEGAK